MDITETPPPALSNGEKVNTPQNQRSVSVAAGDKFHVIENTFCRAQITAEITNLNEKLFFFIRII